MPQKPADLNHFPQAAAPAAEFNKFLETVDNEFLRKMGYKTPETSPTGRKIDLCKTFCWDLKVLFIAVVLLSRAISVKGKWL